MAEHDLLSKDALDQDWRAAEAYTNYSAELLRLSLLAMTGIATLLFKLSDKPGVQISQISCGFQLAIAAFLISAMCALFHRFVATDAMVYHITHLRLKEKLSSETAATDPSIQQRSYQEKQGRDRNLHLATWLLRISAASLLAGVLLSVHPVVHGLSAHAATTPSTTPASTQKSNSTGEGLPTPPTTHQ
jgi:hypothetical protein